MKPYLVNDPSPDRQVVGGNIGTRRGANFKTQ